ncbi:MAG: HD-GYP domain-containing protein [Gaiellaceae bacterium]|jgi:putative nucleotidyltransferase with HDIG domain
MPSSINIDNRGQSPSRETVGTPLPTDSIKDRAAMSLQRLLVLRGYVGATAAAALGLVFLIVSRGYGFGPVIPTVVMAGAALISEKQTVRMNQHLELSVTFLPALFSAVVLGPLSAMVVALASLLVDLRRPWERWLIWSSSRCLILGLASLAATLVGSRETLGGLFAAVATASVIVVLSESVIGSLTVAIRGVEILSAHFRETAKIMGFGLLVYIPVIAGLAYIYELVSPWAVVLFIGPAIAAQRFFVLYREQMRTATELTVAIEKLERVNLSFATALVAALDARDHYTAGHSAAVAVYTRDIAKRIELSEEETNRAHLCGLLHDIGKIGVPTGVLEKSGPLKRDERLAIETHAETGASILERIEGYEEIARAVRHHHERYDGFGYPHGLQGEEIPIIARLVAVADAYSAMTSERPYRRALVSSEARKRIEREAGKQFDPNVVKAFITVLGQASEAYVSGTDSDFEIEIGYLETRETNTALTVSS